MKIFVILFLTFLIIAGQLSIAQKLNQLEQSSTPINELLNSDGTLNLTTGFSGSLNPSGWKMVTEFDRQPKFIQEKETINTQSTDRIMAVGDEKWYCGFDWPGTDSESFTFTKDVYVILIDGTDVYIGGEFTYVGGISANRIAKWDGCSWSALSSGMNGSIWALAKIGTDLYAGGWFTTAGGVSASAIAKWDGISWSALGIGMDASVYALAVNGTDLYAGGYFTNAGGVLVNNIAKWDGSLWTALEDVGIYGVNNTVWALATDGSGNLYAGGEFTNAGSLNGVNRIAKWNGSTWSGFGSGADNRVYAIAVDGSNFYIGGLFNEVGGDTSIHCIAKWGGSSWSKLGTGMSGKASNTEVSALVVTGSGDLYAGGWFTKAGGTDANHLAKWNGSSWSALGDGLGHNVSALGYDGSDLFVGGGFTTAGSMNAYHIAKWDGSSWFTMGNGINEEVNAIAVSGNNVYVGGNFTQVGGISANQIAKWDGSSWSTLGIGVNNEVKALAISGTNLYAGGHFTDAGGVTVEKIAMWNGSSWSALGSGMNSTVTALALRGNDLYAGGSFTTAGGVSANRIAKWDGSSWSALGSGMDNQVYTITINGTDLYAGGSFHTAGGITAHGIAKWDGGSWDRLGFDNLGIVYAIAVNGSNIYAGGTFTNVGSNDGDRIAKWDGSSWSALGSGMDDYVKALSFTGNNLYAGGYFENAGGIIVNNIAKWNGSSWSVLGSGMGRTKSSSFVSVNVIEEGDGDLFIGGDFGTAGNKPSYHIAQYEGCRVLLETKIFLEGAYDSTSNAMTLSLNSGGYIPTTSPYSEDPRTVSSIGPDVTDWVLVQLRSTATGDAVISKSAFIHVDGRIVADDGVTGQITLPVCDGDYYIVIKHRNHLAVMSATAQTLNNSSSTLFDFTNID